MKEAAFITEYSGVPSIAPQDTGNGGVMITKIICDHNSPKIGENWFGEFSEPISTGRKDRRGAEILYRKFFPVKREEWVEMRENDLILRSGSIQVKEEKITSIRREGFIITFSSELEDLYWKRFKTCPCGKEHRVVGFVIRGKTYKIGRVPAKAEYDYYETRDGADVITKSAGWDYFLKEEEIPELSGEHLPFNNVIASR